MKKFIYLSNPGFICAAGDSKNPEQFVKNLAAGKRDGIKKIECGIKSEDSSENPPPFFVGKIEDSKLKPTGDKFDMRLLQILNFALDGIESCVQKAISKYGKERIGVCIGSCDNGTEISFEAHKSFFKNGAFPKDYELKIQGADYPVSFTEKRFGTKGLCLAFSTACSSSASAIIKAKEVILSGLCDAVICGGVDVASDMVLLGFDSLEAVSHEKTNPFSKNRCGINLGEGASVFLLSKDDLDETCIILAGTGESSDASHITAPLADGSGAAQAMKAALNDAGLSPNQIDYINLHGTGTHLNDSMEGKAVDSVFKDYKVPASSAKPMTGHTLGAAGSLELAECFWAIKSQSLPAHVWDKVQDQEIPVLNLVSTNNIEEIVKNREINACISNSFAFGGCNTSLIIRKIK